MTRTERQLLAIEKWKKVKCRGSLVGNTGFGKTRMALMAITRVLAKYPDLKVTIVVPTKPLREQWSEKLEEYGLIGNNINILIINTAAKKPFDCNFLIIDECHHISAEGMSNIFKNCSPLLILGLTATYERLDGREKEVLDHYAPVFDEVTIDDAINDALQMTNENKGEEIETKE